MTKKLLFLFLSISSVFFLNAQVIFDFETPETTTTYKYFGSSLDGSSASNIANPNPTGVNTSSTVLEFTKPAGAEVWAGAYADPAPSPIDATGGGQICVDVHMDHIGNLALKLEASSTGGANWITTQQNTVVNQWETLCFDLDALGLEDDMSPATGDIYNQLVLFADFGSMGEAADVLYYFDNITLVPPTSKTCIFDWETAETTTTYKYFGSTLDGSSASNIANPNPTGINTSSTVLEFTKPAGAEVWAGAYADPAPGPIDATGGGQICVDVHMDHIGNLALKLEASSTGGANWITTQNNTVVNAWETLCFDLDDLGLEDDMSPATGDIYNQLVLFADFGTMGGATDVISYFDNICLETSAGPQFHDVTFSVDMNNYSGSFTQVYVSGEFNNWSADANPLTNDGNNVWSTTMNLAVGAYEYKFQLDNWATSEQFNPSDECTATFINDQGEVFTNRVLALTAETTVAVCYESCYACGDEVRITWNLNMQNEDVSDLGVYVAGGLYFGHGDLPAMTDNDGDGVYTITLKRKKGFTTDYTFINGLCLPDWGCKENISGQSCAVAPFNDRRLEPVMEDTEINTCFGECSTDGTCSGGPAKYAATFQVDTRDIIVNGGMFLSGGVINNWSPDATPMADVDGDGIYTVTVDLFPGVVEYKYVNGTEYETLEDGICTITDPSGQFINRLLLMEDKDVTVDAYLYGTCNLFVDVNNIIYNENLFTVSPNPVANITIITCEIKEPKQIQIMDLNGAVINTFNMSAAETTFNVSTENLHAGMYIVTITSDQFRSAKRIIKQ